MFTIDVRADIAEMKKKLDFMKRQQLPFATSLAVNKVAVLAEQDLEIEIARVFDRPTARTLRAIRYTKASKQLPVATLFLAGSQLDVDDRRGSPAQYLEPEISGGYRKQKGLEVWMVRAGLLSSGEYVVPASGAPLDGNGNLRAGLVQQIMSQLRLGLDPYSWKTGSARSKRNVARAGQFFWSRGGHLPRGVWQRVDRSVKPILLVSRRPQYAVRFKFHDVARQSVERNWKREFGQALAYALATAK